MFAWSTIGGTDYIILYAEAGHDVEALISGVTGQTRVSGSSTISASSVSNSTFVVSGTPAGISSISTGDSVVLLADKRTALSFWNVHLPSSDFTVYDQAPDVPSVFVFGPYLVRNASLSDSGTVLAIHGDLNATTTIDIIAPPSVKRVTWNGEEANVKVSNIGTLRGQLEFSLRAPQLPNLKTIQWACTDALPEIQREFDDSKWITANKTSTARPYQPLAGKARFIEFRGVLQLIFILLVCRVCG